MVAKNLSVHGSVVFNRGEEKKTKDQKNSQAKKHQTRKKKEKKKQLKQGLKAGFPISLFNFQLEVVVSTLYRINSPL